MSPLGRLTLDGELAAYRIIGGRDPHPVDGSLTDALRSLRYQLTLLFLGARPDLLWVHAASAARDGRAVLIVGRGGSGKSTLVTRLLARGFTYLGDDVIPIDPEKGVAYSFPIEPSVRPAPGRPVPVEAVQALPKTVVSLDAAQICRSPVPVDLLVLPAYESGAARAWPSPPAHAAARLLRHSLNPRDSRERVIRAVCARVAAWPALVLRFDDADRATDLIVDALVEAREPRLAVG